MLSKRLIALAGLAASLVWVSAANAVTVSIGLQETGFNGGAKVTVASAINDTAVFAGGYGTFSSNTITANGNPPLPVPSDLLGSTAFNISTTTAGTLNVFVTAQNISSPIGAISFISSFTQNILSGAISSVTESTYLDTGNGLFETTTLLSSHTFTGIDTIVLSSLTQGIAGPYSLTQKYTIVATGSGSVLSTIDIAATPLPGTLPLIAGGLGALWVVGRKRKTGKTSATT
jgi:hypothetical protein